MFFSHVLDDGGGMDPEALRRCMSFGFSDKQSDALIGQCIALCTFSAVLWKIDI